MRGSPLLRALLAFAVIFSLGFPLWRLTRSEVTASTQAKPSAPPVAKSVTLKLAFTLLPRSVAVLHLGREIWRENTPAAEIEHESQIPFPAEGVELQFQIDWPETAALAAMRATLTDPTGEEHVRSVWGRGRVEEVLTFP